MRTVAANRSFGPVVVGDVVEAILFLAVEEAAWIAVDAQPVEDRFRSRVQTDDLDLCASAAVFQHRHFQRLHAGNAPDMGDGNVVYRPLRRLAEDGQACQAHGPALIRVSASMSCCRFHGLKVKPV